MQAIDPDHLETKQQIFELRDRVSKVEGEVRQINQTASDNTRQTIWQFVIFTITMGAILLGGLNYQTNALRNESNARFEKIEQQMKDMQKLLEQRIELSEKNMTARFEDLKQEVRNRK